MVQLSTGNIGYENNLTVWDSLVQMEHFCDSLLFIEIIVIGVKVTIVYMGLFPHTKYHKLFGGHG